jgi:hypothetical protein
MMWTEQQVADLANAMWQLLDDMGRDGLSVCGAAKAQARIAYEPFRQPEDDPIGEFPNDYQSLEEAQAIIESCRQ